MRFHIASPFWSKKRCPGRPRTRVGRQPIAAEHQGGRVAHRAVEFARYVLDVGDRRLGHKRIVNRRNDGYPAALGQDAGEAHDLGAGRLDRPIAHGALAGPGRAPHRPAVICRDVQLEARMIADRIAEIFEGAEPGAQPGEDLGRLDQRYADPPRQRLSLKSVEDT